MDYYQYTIRTAIADPNIVIALLGDAPFDTFEETDEGVKAYAPANEAAIAAADEAVAAICEEFGGEWERALIPGQNWNELWESNFQPVIVRDFCAVRADFHAPISDVRHELVINPKMAFGTGHHETTWMCMSAMEQIPLQGADALDYGCGTGVLAILAVRLGARSVEAVDIEEESYLNTIENAAVNRTDGIIPRHGTLESVEGRQFDVILANINRNVILDSLPELAARIKAGGLLLVSGILAQDEATINEAAAAVGFERREGAQRGAWACILFAKQ